MKQIYNIMVGMALMLGATSCEEEILDNGQAAGIALADGQFIVDYSGEVTTRAIKDNAEKGERINSLTYLLYMQQENDYVLQKRREIPGLDGDSEDWPLTRDNMTWEQREALKDTLMVGSNYRAVFVANADASLWGGTSPLVNASMPRKCSPILFLCLPPAPRQPRLQRREYVLSGGSRNRRHRTRPEYAL